MTIKNKNTYEQKKLFDILAKHYDIFTKGNRKNIFCCPLCLEEFSEQAIYEERLSLAHIIPDFLGGKIYSLACSRCNNTIGSQIEGKESKRIAHWDSFQIEDCKKNRRNSSMSLPEWEGEIPTSMKFNENGVINADIYSADPKLIDEFIDTLKNNNSTTFNIEIPLPDWDESRLTYLHAAYMFMFQQFGYYWTHNSCSQAIREQIENPKKKVINFIPITLNSDCDDSILNQTEYISLYKVIEPESADGYYVVFNQIYLDNTYPISVWLPALNKYYALPKKAKFKLSKMPVFISQSHLINPHFNYADLSCILFSKS